MVNRIREKYPAATLCATWNTTPPDDPYGKNIHWTQLDLCSESSVKSFAEQHDSVHWLINAAGFLHSEERALMPEKSLQQIDPEFFLQSVKVNALPTLLIARHFEAALKHDEPAHFATVSAKVGSIADNRLGGWHSYRCSKAALNMALKNISIEWRRKLPNVCVTALHPGTTNTQLSAPFQRNVSADKLFTKEFTATCLVDLLSARNAEDTGKFLAYDGEELPW